MAKTVALLGALDTKGAEYGFVKECIEALGLGTLVIDVGVLGPPRIAADVPREEVARAAGAELADLAARQDRGEAVAAMARGAEAIVPRLYVERRFDGILALGGGGGTSVACAAMRALPLGVPKVMVSTVAGTDVSGYVGVKDIVMIPSIVDVAGINRISREVFARAAGAICGMLGTEVPAGDDKPLVAASMFGNTTPCVEAAKAILEHSGYEVLVFHATGTGGQSFEKLVDSGMMKCVLDITTTEICDHLMGGVLSAGEGRLDAFIRTGIPYVGSVGALDMVNFGAMDTVPEKYKGRKLYVHNPQVTLMRTTPEENARMGEWIGEKLNRFPGPVRFLLPLKGVSMIDAPGQAFHWPEADEALFTALERTFRQSNHHRLVKLPLNVNDPEFAAALVENFRELHP